MKSNPCLPLGHVRQAEDLINGGDPSCALCGGSLDLKYQFGARAIRYCSGCRLGQLVPVPTDGELTQLYASRSYFEGSDRVGYANYAADAPQLTRTFRAKLDQLMRFGSVHDLLEIGCGPGLFLAEARARHCSRDRHRSQPVGYRGSPAARPRGVRRLDRRAPTGTEVRCGHHARPPGACHDAAALAGCGASAAASGRTAVHHDAEHPFAAGAGLRPAWVSFKIPEHVFYYSPRSIQMLLERAGFEVISTRGTGQYVTMEFLFSRLRSLAPRLTRACELGAQALQLHARVVFITNGSIDAVARVRA